MKIFKKFNPNEDYLIRIQISMAVVLIAINFAFTRTVDRMVDKDLVVCQLPIPDEGVMNFIPPPSPDKKISHSSLGPKVVIKELFSEWEADLSEPEEEFIFDPNKTPKFTGIIKSEVKVGKIDFHIPNSEAEFPGGNDRIPQYLEPRIEYPEEAVSMGASCAMLVELVIDENGFVKRVNIISENEDAYYFRESIRTVLLAMPKFAPAVSNNRYIESRILVPVQFILN